MTQQSQQDQILIYYLLSLVFSSKIVQTHPSHPQLCCGSSAQQGPRREVDPLQLQICFVSLAQPCMQNKYTEGSVLWPDPKAPLCTACALLHNRESCGADALSHRHCRCSQPFSFSIVPCSNKKGGNIHCRRYLRGSNEEKGSS